MTDTITLPRAVIKQAVKALAECYDVESYPSNGSTQQDAALTELRAALAQQAEPAVEPAEKSILNNSANSAIYAKGHADGRKEAMADIRELLGITNGSLDL